MRSGVITDTRLVALNRRRRASFEGANRRGPQRRFDFGLGPHAAHWFLHALTWDCTCTSSCVVSRRGVWAFTNRSTFYINARANFSSKNMVGNGLQNSVPGHPGTTRNMEAACAQGAFHTENRGGELGGTRRPPYTVRLSPFDAAGNYRKLPETPRNPLTRGLLSLPRGPTGLAANPLPCG